MQPSPAALPSINACSLFGKTSSRSFASFPVLLLVVRGVVETGAMEGDAAGAAVTLEDCPFVLLRLMIMSSSSASKAPTITNAFLGEMRLSRAVEATGITGAGALG